MGKWAERKHPRDAHGRFKTILKGVRGGKSKVISRGFQSTRQRSAGLRIGGGQNARLARGVEDWVGDVGRRAQSRLAVGAGMRRRGQVVRSVERVNRIVVVPTEKVRRGRPRRRR